MATIVLHSGFQVVKGHRRIPKIVSHFHISPEETHTVTTPLMPPRSRVPATPPFTPGYLAYNLSCRIANVEKRTAEFVPCLHSTGPSPRQSALGPSCRTMCAAVSVNPLALPMAASCTSRVLSTSPGVTTSKLSVTPAPRPAQTLIQALACPRSAPESRPSSSRIFSNEKKRTPDLQALLMASVPQPE